MSEKMKGKYGFPVAFSMVVGIVIGVGIFFKAEGVLKSAGMNPKIAIAAWVLAGVISILSGLTAAEIGAMVPEQGGIIAWIRRVYGDRLAYLVGWAQATVYAPSITAIMAYYFGVFALELLGITASSGYSPEKIKLIHMTITFGGFLIVFVTNTYTKKGGGMLQAVSTVCKLIPLLAVIIFGLASTNNSDGIFHMSEAVRTNTDGHLFSLLGAALASVVFSFDGWMYVGTISGELKDVKKDLPKAIIFGLGLIILVYVALNIGLLRVFTAEEIIANNGVFGVAKAMLGDTGAKFVFAGIVISAFGGLNGFSLVSTRVPYLLASSGNFKFGHIFNKIDEKTEQPLASCWGAFVIIVSILCVMFATGQVDVFGDVPVALFWGFYSLVFLGVIILRIKEPNAERPYRVPLFPIIPILSILGGVSILVYSTINNFTYAVISITITLLGLFLYKSKK